MRLLFLVLLLVACSPAPAASPSPSGVSINGSFVLTSPSTVWSSKDCFGFGGYDDIRSGAPVTVKDGKGTIVGVTSLVLDASRSASGHCAYTFTLIASDADFYTIEVAHRGGVTFPKAEVGQVSLTLGK